MPVLGFGGRVRLRREAPEPVVLTTAALHRLSNSFYVRNPGYWSGDRVTLVAVGGLPIDAGQEAAACPDGHAFYAAGGSWDIGPNRAHVKDDRDTFYNDDDDAPFYVTEGDVGLVESCNVYIYRDQLDRLSFYSSRDAALRGSKDERIMLRNVSFGSLLLGAYGSIDYQNALLGCSASLDLGDYGSGYIEDEATLESLGVTAPDYSAPADDYGDTCDDCDLALDRWLWSIQGEVSEWSLNLSAQEVETTAVGEKFGDSIKSVVTGGGSIDFLVTRNTTQDKNGKMILDATSLMRLLLMSEKGCKADAQFWMIENQADRCKLLPGDLYYETQMLVTSIAINTRATDIIAGSMNFVTVGEISLRMGIN